MVYMYHSFLIRSSADGHLGCLKNCILRKLFLLTEKTKFQSGTSLLLIIKFVYLVNLKKISSINLEVAVFLQRHQSETTEDMFKI